MSNAAFGKISEGLREALAITRSEATKNMTIPTKVNARRAELIAMLSGCADARSQLDAEIIRTDHRGDICRAALDALALADAAYAEQSPAAAETEPAAPTRATRAPRRDIRGMVLDVARAAPDGITVDPFIVAELGARTAQVRAAIEYWLQKGELWVADGVGADGVVKHRDFLPAPVPQPIDIAAE